VRILLGVVAAALLSGCGAAHPDGRAVFSRACSRCHTLMGHDTAAPGGDLAVRRMRRGDLESFARVMPVSLTTAELRAVAGYVEASQARLAP
jgi:mono/diheme cytochrome c family protein